MFLCSFFFVHFILFFIITNQKLSINQSINELMFMHRSVLHDLMLGCAKLGVNVRIATPKGYECNPSIMQKTQELAVENGTESVFVTNVAEEAVKGSDVVVTDTCKCERKISCISPYIIVIYLFIHFFSSLLFLKSLNSTSIHFGFLI